MDQQYNNQQGNSYQQGNGYQQGNPYQQGNGYQQGNPYQQGNGYQQGNSYQQGNGYQQGSFYQQGNGYQQGNNTNIGSGYGGDAEPQKAPNIFQQFVFAFVPAKYNSLIKVKTGSMIGFVTLLVLAATLLSAISLAIGFAGIDMDELVEAMPDFAIVNGQMYLEEEFLYDEGATFVYMTEDIDEFSYEDASDLASEGYRDIILVGRDRISVMQNGEYQQIDFSDFRDTFGDTMEISRDWLVSVVMPFIMVGMIFAYLILFVGKGLWYFFAALVYMLFAMLIASVMNKNLETGALFRVAVYAKVLMFVIATVLSLIPFANIAVPFLLRVAITIGFMGFAISKLPDNRPTPMNMYMGQGWQ